MGALIRAYHWAETPLGAVQTWPQSLRTALSILLDSGYPMYIAWGPEFIQLYNDAYRAILGSKHPSALGQPTPECFAEIWEFIGPMFQRVLADGENTTLVDQILPLDRFGYLEECYFTFSYSAIRDESGRPSGVFVTVIETTGRVLAERRLRTQQELAAQAADAKNVNEAARRAVETLFADPYDIPFALLYLLDSSTRRFLLVAAAGVQRNTEVDPLELPQDNSSPWPLAKMIREGRTLLVKNLQGSFPSGLPAAPWPEPIQEALLVPIARPGQESQQLAGVLIAGVSPRRAVDEGYRAFIELVAGQISSALSNARAYEEERMRAEALAELDRAKIAFFSNVSHEFRTPLSLMLGPLEDLLAGPSIGDTRGQLEVVHRNGVRLLKLVNTLLDFSRIEAGRIQACYQLTDLAALTTDLASLFRSATERAGLALRVDCPPLPAEVYVDREMWEKIVLNLLSNAFKFTLKGEIAVSLQVVAGSVEFSVRDTGLGIRKADLERVFDRFQRIEGAEGRTHEGSGIGLALVQELTRLHGGRVSLESEYGKGSLFTVVIPVGRSHLPADRIVDPSGRLATALRAQPYVEEVLRWLPEVSSVAGRDAPSMPDEPARLEATNASGLILVADDNADMRDYLRRLLSNHYQVVAVPDGLTALATIRTRRPDLVLSDVMMPRLDGFGLLRTLRNDPLTSTIPVILLSARAGEEAQVEGLQAGADDYLVKPFSARELLARVASNLAIARLRRESAERERNLRALAEAERERWHHLLLEAPALIAVLRGPDHIVELANPAYLRAIGKEGSPSILGQPIRQVRPEMAGQGLLDLLDRVYRTGEPFIGKRRAEYLDRRGDGNLEEFFFDSVYQPSRNLRGEVEGILVHAVDITAQVRARQHVEESEKRLSAIFNQASVGIAQTDLSGRFVLANQRYCEIVGRPLADLLQMRLRDITYPGDLDRSQQRFREIVETGVQLEIEKRYVRPNGSIVWALVSIALVRNDTGKPGYVLAVAQDITDRKRAEDELKRVNQDLQQFAFAASHDLQEPLRMVTSYSQLLLKSYPGHLTGDAAMFVDNIRQGTRRMRELLEDLLAYTSAGAMASNSLEIVDLGRVLETAKHNLSSSIEETGATISSETLPRVMGHETHFVQVFQNLISNALKYRSEKSPVIRIAAERQNSVTLVSVHDNGMGIEPQYHEKVFGVFKRLHGKKIPGTGIGLAICQRVVERYGGKIWVESRLGEGASFYFTLPAMSEDTNG